MTRIVFASLIMALAVPVLVWAAGLGNPASVIGPENYGFSMEVENQKKVVEGDLVESRRYLGKAIWGVTDRLDLYARFGASGIKVHVDDAPDFHGSDGMTYGGGGRFLVASSEAPRILAVIDVQGLSYFSKGTAMLPQSSGGSAWIAKYRNRYKWDEIQFSFFTVWQRDIWQPYVGFTIVNVFGNVEKNVYRLVDDQEDFIRQEANDFREDAIPEFVAGMEFEIGGTGRCGAELRLSHNQASFCLGLSELWH